MKTHLEKKEAEDLFIIILKYGGSTRLLKEFMQYFTNPTFGNFYEFRCLPSLGFGGKIKLDLGSTKLYASFYSEDYTEERNKILLNITNDLQKLADGWFK